MLDDDPMFAGLDPARGQPALTPSWRLALVTVLRFVENLSDRQTAEAVRGRIDWKYALGLELADPGFDFSVLGEFRARLLAGGREEQLLLEALLRRLQGRGLLKARGGAGSAPMPRTSWPPCAPSAAPRRSARPCGRPSTASPPPRRTGLLRCSRPEWFERYAVRVDADRLPRSEAGRAALAGVIGRDGHDLLAARPRRGRRPARAAGAAGRPSRSSGASGASGSTRRTGGSAGVRRPTGRRRAGGCALALRPRGRVRRQARPDLDRLRGAPHRDLRSRHAACDRGGADHPGRHGGQGRDGGDPPRARGARPRARPALGRQRLRRCRSAGDEPDGAPDRVDGPGPARPDTSWHGRAGQGFDVAAFTLDRAARVARCPEGRTSVRWREFAQPLRGITVRIAFDRRTCQACVSRARCTQARAGPRTLSLLPQAEHAAAQRRRRRREQETAAWRQSYARRAGVEGTLSQGIRAFGLRRCRYIGLAKAHLRHVLTAVAINLVRLDAWLRGEPSAPTRISRFTRLKAALG